MDVPSEDYSSYFRDVHGRKVNVLNARYALPADDEELKVRARAFGRAFFPSLLRLHTPMCAAVRYTSSLDALCPRRGELRGSSQDGARTGARS